MSDKNQPRKSSSIGPYLSCSGWISYKGRNRVDQLSLQDRRNWAGKEGEKDLQRPPATVFKHGQTISIVSTHHLHLIKHIRIDRTYCKSPLEAGRGSPLGRPRRPETFQERKEDCRDNEETDLTGANAENEGMNGRNKYIVRARKLLPLENRCNIYQGHKRICPSLLADLLPF